MTPIKQEVFFPVQEIEGEFKGGYYSKEGFFFSEDELKAFIRSIYWHGYMDSAIGNFTSATDYLKSLNLK